MTTATTPSTPATDPTTPDPGPTGTAANPPETPGAAAWLSGPIRHLRPVWPLADAVEDTYPPPPDPDAPHSPRGIADSQTDQWGRATTDPTADPESATR